MPLILQRLHGKNQSESVLESPDMVNGKDTGTQLFLASNSPRRRELLALGGWDYGILTTPVDETPLPAEDGRDYVLRLAISKAVTAARQAGVEGVIIAADTTVIDDQGDGKARILGKPCDQDDAAEMLRSLRGRTHQVHTAIAIISNQNGSMLTDLCTTDDPRRNYSDDEIDDYVARGDPLDNAGAYAIQHAGFHPVEEMDGCFANVMGLPLCHLTRCLAHTDITPQANIPQSCQAATGYNCPVYHQILIESF